VVSQLTAITDGDSLKTPPPSVPVTPTLNLDNSGSLKPSKTHILNADDEHFDPLANPDLEMFTNSEFKLLPKTPEEDRPPSVGQNQNQCKVKVKIIIRVRRLRNPGGTGMGKNPGSPSSLSKPPA
jgi:hypothetical protein